VQQACTAARQSGRGDHQDDPMNSHAARSSSRTPAERIARSTVSW
jgi:hypothetical protein